MPSADMTGAFLALQVRRSVQEIKAFMVANRRSSVLKNSLFRRLGAHTSSRRETAGIHTRRLG
jgi:hypothetical protein